MSQTITDIFANAAPDQIVVIVARLEHLPEFGCRRKSDAVAVHANEILRLKDLLRREEDRLREAASDLLGYVRGNWTAAEIERATGYRPE